MKHESTDTHAEKPPLWIPTAAEMEEAQQHGWTDEQGVTVAVLREAMQEIQECAPEGNERYRTLTVLSQLTKAIQFPNMHRITIEQWSDQPPEQLVKPPGVDACEEFDRNPYRNP